MFPAIPGVKFADTGIAFSNETILGIIVYFLFIYFHNMPSRQILFTTITKCLLPGGNERCIEHSHRPLLYNSLISSTKEWNSSILIEN